MELCTYVHLQTQKGWRICSVSSTYRNGWWNIWTHNFQWNLLPLHYFTSGSYEFMKFTCACSDRGQEFTWLLLPSDVYFLIFTFIFILLQILFSGKSSCAMSKKLIFVSPSYFYYWKWGANIILKQGPSSPTLEYYYTSSVNDYDKRFPTYHKIRILEN